MTSSREGWRRVAFGDVVRNVSEAVANPVAAGLDRAIGLEHLDPGELAIKRWAAADGLTFTRRFRAGQVLYGRRRVYQRKAGVPDFDGVCSSDIYVLEPSNGALVSELLPFIVQSEPFREHALRTSAGSLSPRTKWVDLKKFEFDLPPTDEQHRLATLLGAAEDLTGAYKRSAEATQRAWRAFLDSEISRCLSDTAPLKDHVASSAYGPRFSSEAYSPDGDVALIRTTDLDETGLIDYSTLPRASVDGGFAEHYLRDGDFLISRSGTCGIPAVFEAAHVSVPVLAGAFLIRLRLRPSLDPWFLRLVFLSAFGERLIRQLARGGVQKNIRGSLLLDSVIPVPTLDRQARIRSLADELLASLALQRSQIARTAAVTSTLMKGLLRG